MDRTKSLETLEYNKVIDLLESQAVSQGGKKLCSELLPFDDIYYINSNMQNTTDAKDLMTTRGSPGFWGVKDVVSSLGRAKIGGVLNLKELIDISILLKTIRQVKAYGEDEGGLSTSIGTFFESLNPNKYLEERISSAVINEEELADSASSELYALRRRKRALESKIRDILNKTVASQPKYLQDSVITIRSGRYVIPVKSEMRSEISGLVHDVSSSGATVFIEPTAVVNTGNELRVIEAKEQEEIIKILAEFSKDVAVFSESIEDNYRILVKLDYIFAKAKLSFELECGCPVITQGGETNIVKARHPLMDKKSAVPIDIAIGGKYDTLVITGPNTGGKTVSLKTLGLLILMAQSGLHIPASDLSVISVYNNIFADIGDEQSIEQSLSTFSSHMKNIQAVTEICTKGDLILFDELGAGTDPIEGAALAVSIIEFCRKMGCHICATTHYAELKAYALTTKGVENGSCQFDVSTLQPTYRLLIGVPGKSNAFAISKRLGLDESIIERARVYISSDNAKFEDLLELLEDERIMLEKYKQETENLRRIAQSEKDKARTLSDKTQEEHENIIDDARKRAQEILYDAKMTSQAVLNQIDDLAKKDQKNIKEETLNRAKKQMNESLSKSQELIDSKSKIKKRKTKQNIVDMRDLIVGTNVKVSRFGSVATVITLPDKDGNLQVRAGIMKMNVNISDLEPVLENSYATNGKELGKRYTNVSTLYKVSAKTELDIRGLNVDEGILEIDQFISGAILSHLDTITVIHGKGTGVLRAAVQKHLKNHKSVKSFRAGRYGEGEMGVTIITLK